MRGAGHVLARLGPFERRLLLAWLWIAGAVVLGELFVFALWVVPIVQLLPLALVPLPTVLLYLTPALLLYAVPALLWARREAGPTAQVRGGVLALLCAAMGGLGWLAAKAVNARPVGWPPVTAPATPVTLQPVGRVALLELSGHERPLPPRCNSFCITLLMSGLAREVDVARARTDALGATLPLPGARFRLADDTAGCVRPSPTWRYHEGKPLAEAWRIGGFDDGLGQRFAACITGTAASVGPADLRIVHALPRQPRPLWLGMAWGLPTHRVVSEWRVEASDGRALAQWRHAVRHRYLAPLMLSPLSGNAASGRGPTHWAHVDEPAPDTPAAAPEGAPRDWWATVANAEAVYALALAEAGLRR